VAAAALLLKKEDTVWHESEWAIGNLFNHPPFGVLPHCMVVPFPYLDMRCGVMKQTTGLAFWCIRGLAAGEEAFLDYRLSPVVVEQGDDIDFQYPHWYHPVDLAVLLADVEAQAVVRSHKASSSQQKSINGTAAASAVDIIAVPSLPPCRVCGPPPKL